MRRKKAFDLVFLDPPYAMGVLPEVLRTLVDYRLLRPNAKLVCESAAEGDVFGNDAALESRFEVLRRARYGVAYVTVLQWKDESGEAEA